jgi:hypothetical protein
MKSIFLVLFLFYLVPIQGSCGLENCKDPSKVKKTKSVLSLELGTRYTSFTYRDTDGYYEELSLRGTYINKNDWMLDFKIPAISFHYNGYETTGMSNPILGGEKWFRTGNFSPLFGLQIELPIGEEDKGIAPNHWEMLPYIGCGYTTGNYSFRLVAGYRFSMGGSEHSDPVVVASEKKYHSGHVAEDATLTLAELGPQVVNFHGEEEVQLFLSGGRSFFNDRFYAGLQSTVRQVTAGEDKLLLMYGGPTVQYNNQYFKLQSQFNIPFSSDKKMNWNIGLNLIVSF